MLEAEQKQQLERALRETQQRVLQHAQSALDISRDGPPESGRDSIDQSTTEELVSTAFRLRDREQKLLAKIREAIERLEEDTIDECEVCGGEIAFKRLLARPVTTLCIECKESAEEEERRQAGAEPGAGPEVSAGEEW